MQMYSAQIPAEILQRGFWLYVWEIQTEDERNVFYVGRTGDSSSVNASAPISRMSQHLGENKNNNTLKRHLLEHGIKARKFHLHAYGPIHPEQDQIENHKIKLDEIAAYEKALCILLKEEMKLEVLNTVNSRKNLNELGWLPIKTAFKKKLKHLK